MAWPSKNAADYYDPATDKRFTLGGRRDQPKVPWTPARVITRVIYAPAWIVAVTVERWWVWALALGTLLAMMAADRQAEKSVGFTRWRPRWPGRSG